MVLLLYIPTANAKLCGLVDVSHANCGHESQNTMPVRNFCGAFKMKVINFCMVG
jgi:hypothetical protein